MAAEAEDEIPDSGAIFTFGKSKFAENIPSKFWLKNDKPLYISCGDEHTALVTGNGKLYMFGSNNWGQLGLGTKTTVNKPTCVKALKSEKVKLVACGRSHTLTYTVSVDGKLFMWGDNSEGQIGLGEKSNVCVPHLVDIRKQISWVSCGYYHSALVTAGGELYTFGESENGKLGLPSEKLENTRVPKRVPEISGKVILVACGGGHTVALTDHNLYTFGLGQFGQLGHGTLIFESHKPKVVEQLQNRNVQFVECGENHTAVITDNGLLYTFGDGRHGKLGLGDENFTNQFKPTLCPRFIKYIVQSVACGGCHMLVLARPRFHGSEEDILHKDDVNKNPLTDTNSELIWNPSMPGVLQRTLSARGRRREREQSLSQSNWRTRTLPPLGAEHSSSSSLFTNHTVPSTVLSDVHGIDFPEFRAANQNETSTVPSRTGMKNKGSAATEKKPAEENSDDEIDGKGLGDTMDLLNVTHVMSLNPTDKTLILSPVHKEKKKSKNEKGHGKGGLKQNNSNSQLLVPKVAKAALKDQSHKLIKLPSGVDLKKQGGEKIVKSSVSKGNLKKMRTGKENIKEKFQQPSSVTKVTSAFSQKIRSPEILVNKEKDSKDNQRELKLVKVKSQAASAAKPKSTSKGSKENLKNDCGLKTDAFSAAHSQETTACLKTPESLGQAEKQKSKNVSKNKPMNKGDYIVETKEKKFLEEDSAAEDKRDARKGRKEFLKQAALSIFSSSDDAEDKSTKSIGEKKLEKEQRGLVKKKIINEMDHYKLESNSRTESKEEEEDEVGVTQEQDEESKENTEGESECLDTEHESKGKKLEAGSLEDSEEENPEAGSEEEESDDEKGECNLEINSQDAEKESEEKSDAESADELDEMEDETSEGEEEDSVTENEDENSAEVEDEDEESSEAEEENSEIEEYADEEEEEDDDNDSKIEGGEEDEDSETEDGDKEESEASEDEEGSKIEDEEESEEETDEEEVEEGEEEADEEEAEESEDEEEEEENEEEEEDHENEEEEDEQENEEESGAEEDSDIEEDDDDDETKEDETKEEEAKKKIQKGKKEQQKSEHKGNTKKYDLKERKQKSGSQQKTQSKQRLINGSHNSDQFWNHVLPHYLTLN
nr:PREDICTED: X-linked retinitis pigmentosa GTPase regulator [Latimeria chalumnae]|eukprot:XP_014343477.1 PREDICTED: X-linked retinitis pigmentosa GTPase regulator [Latimeria chalumnae]